MGDIVWQHFGISSFGTFGLTTALLNRNFCLRGLLFAAPTRKNHSAQLASPFSLSFPVPENLLPIKSALQTEGFTKTEFEMNDIVGASEDEGSVQSNYYCDPFDLDEHTFRMLKKDKSPYIETLNVGFYENAGFDPLTINWGAEGGAISDNTRLKGLEILGSDLSDLKGATDAREQRKLKRNAKSFLRAVAANKAIRFLSLKGYILKGMGVGETFSSLAGAFEHNHNLCVFDVSYISFDSESAQSLATALLRCKTTLRTIGLIGCDGLDGEVLTTILHVVASRPNIQCLDLSENDISDEAAAALCIALKYTKSLRKLYLRGDCEGRRGSITPNGVQMLAEGLKDSSLEELSLWNNNVGPDGGIHLAEALTENSSLKELDLHRAVSPSHGEFVMSPHGWDTFFGSLQNCAFRSLVLGGNTIGDEDILPMVDSLNTMKSLTDLNLARVHITASGWVEFFDLLQRPGSVLESLTTIITCSFARNDHSINDEVMISFSNALIGNTTLQTVYFDSSDITEEGWVALSRALCNASSIEGIYSSNHTLSHLGSPCRLDPETVSLLELNEEEPKAEVARTKIIKYHFDDGDNTQNLRDLTSMEVEVLPWAIAWAGRDTTGFQLLYRLAQSMPSLFGSQQQQQDGTTVVGKRKWGL